MLSPIFVSPSSIQYSARSLTIVLFSECFTMQMQFFYELQTYQCGGKYHCIIRVMPEAMLLGAMWGAFRSSFGICQWENNIVINSVHIRNNNHSINIRTHKCPQIPGRNGHEGMCFWGEKQDHSEESYHCICFRQKQTCTAVIYINKTVTLQMLKLLLVMKITRFFHIMSVYENQPITYE